MIELPYRGHYTLQSRNFTVYAVEPMVDGHVKPGDQVKIGEIVVTCAATEHHMTTAHPIVGIAVAI